MPDLQLILVVLLALYAAWNLGANDVANSMGTSVGSKALTLLQALAIAGGLEFVGATVFGRTVSATLVTQVVNPAQFARSPQTLLLGMVAVLLSCGLWLQIATRQGWPVASSHAIVGAIAGFSGLAAGVKAIDWTSLGKICLAWIFSPLLSGLIAILLYLLIKAAIIERSNPHRQLREWIPWLSAILFSVFGIIVFPKLFSHSWGSALPLPPQTLALAVGGLAAASLSLAAWKRLDSQGRDTRREGENTQLQAVERQLGLFQVMSASFVAFAHGSNDVGNAIAPLAAIVYILQAGVVPLDAIPVPYWIMVWGGIGIVLGLAVQGKNVIATVGEQIIPLQPSSGFCAELAAAIAVLLASRLGFPVSTSHVLIGAVAGIGLLQYRQQMRWQTLRSVVFAWAVTLPVAALLSALCFSTLQFAFNT